MPCDGRLGDRWRQTVGVHVPDHSIGAYISSDLTDDPFDQLRWMIVPGEQRCLFSWSPRLLSTRSRTLCACVLQYVAEAVGICFAFEFLHPHWDLNNECTWKLRKPVVMSTPAGPPSCRGQGEVGERVSRWLLEQEGKFLAGSPISDRSRKKISLLLVAGLWKHETKQES